MRPLIFYAGAALALSGCSQLALQPVTTTTSTGKTVLSAAAAGADLVKLSQEVTILAAVYATVPSASPTVLSDAAKAETALAAAGNDLKTSGATSGVLSANLKLAMALVTAAEAGGATVSPTTIAKIQAEQAGILATVSLYNSDAAVSGLPTIPLPTT